MHAVWKKQKYFSDLPVLRGQCLCAIICKERYRDLGSGSGVTEQHLAVESRAHHCALPAICSELCVVNNLWNHTVKERLRCAGTSECHLVQAPSSSGITSSWLLHISMNEDATTSLGSLFSVTLTGNKVFPDAQEEFPVFQCVLLLDPCSLHLPCRCWYTLLRSSKLSPLQSELLQLTQHFLIEVRDASLPPSSWWSFMGLSSLFLCLSCTGKPRNWTQHSRWPQRGQMISLNTLSSAAQCAISILCWKSSCWCMFSPRCPAGAPGPFLTNCFPAFAYFLHAYSWWLSCTPGAWKLVTALGAPSACGIKVMLTSLQVPGCSDLNIGVTFALLLSSGTPPSSQSCRKDYWEWCSSDISPFSQHSWVHECLWT